MKLTIVKKNNENKVLDNRLIVPFMYDENWSRNKFDLFLKESIWQKGKTNIYSNSSELYSHIEALVGIDAENTNSLTGNVYDIKKQTLDEYRHGKGTINIDDKKIEIFFEDIKIILFKTGIGFLVIKTNYVNSDNLDEVILGNYFMKSFLNVKQFSYRALKNISKEINNEDIKADQNESMVLAQSVGARDEKVFVRSNLFDYKNHRYERILFKEGSNPILMYSYYQNSNIREIVSFLLKDIPKIIFFNSFVINKKRNSNLINYLPSKANIFSSVVIENTKNNYDKDTIAKPYYWYRKGYIDTYLPTEKDLDIINNDEILQISGESYWSICREAMVNLVLNNNNKGSKFFIDGYEERVATYFYLYIIVLHQYYGLLKIAIEVSQLPSLIDLYSDVNNKNSLSRLNSIRKEMNFFYMKCIFQEVSHITHQNNLYKKMHSILGINDMMYELNTECSTISDLLRIESEKTQLAKERDENIKEKERIEKEELRNKKTEKRFKVFIIIGFLFTFISTFGSVWAWVVYNHDNELLEWLTNNKFFSYLVDSGKFIYQSSITGLILVIAIIISVCTWLLWYIIDKARINKKK